MTNEKMREEFERWARSKSISVRRCVTGERDYVIYEVDLTWQAWQASRENIELELPSEYSGIYSLRDGGFYKVKEVKQKLTEQGFKVK